MPVDVDEPAAGVVDAPRRGNAVAERDVAAMFDDIAPVYDRLNTLMTLGADGGWRPGSGSGALPGRGNSRRTGPHRAGLPLDTGPFRQRRDACIAPVHASDRR